MEALAVRFKCLSFFHEGDALPDKKTCSQSAAGTSGRNPGRDVLGFTVLYPTMPVLTGLGETAGRGALAAQWSLPGFRLGVITVSFRQPRASKLR